MAGRKSSVPAAGGVRSGGLLRLGALAVGALLLGAASGAQRFPVTPQQQTEADTVASQGVAISDLAPNAPASYTIKRGDTLWGISSLFLKTPWRWPQLWGMNKTQIHNPHLIYPGQTLVLVKTADGRAQLMLAGSQPPVAAPASPAPAVAAPAPPVPTERLSPQARDLGSGEAKAIASIPNNQIEPFLSRPKVVTPEELAAYPRIVATQQDRVYLGAGDLAYARGIDSTTHDGDENFHVFRPARPLYDPDDYNRRTPIAYEALYLGTARLVKGGEVASLTIVESKQEIGVGDRLVPIVHQELINYVPHRPESLGVTGRIVEVYGGVSTVGAGSIVTLNRGRKDGLDIGSVLAVMSNGETIVDRTVSSHEKVKLPDEAIGHLFVFRVYDGISYALLVSAGGPVAVGDRFAQPDAVPLSGGAAAAATPTPTAMP